MRPYRRTRDGQKPCKRFAASRMLLCEPCHHRLAEHRHVYMFPYTGTQCPAKANAEAEDLLLRGSSPPPHERQPETSPPSSSRIVPTPTVISSTTGNHRHNNLSRTGPPSTEPDKSRSTRAA